MVVLFVFEIFFLSLQSISETFIGMPKNMVVIAQLVRASVCGTEGRGFEPHFPPLKQKHAAYKRRIKIPIKKSLVDLFL